MMHNSSSSIITALNVSFSYPTCDVLKNVDFSIKHHEFIALIGPNGGGKTTLLKLLMGFLTPSSGEILINGQSPRSYPNGIAYVPQTLRFDRQFPISVLELVLQGLLSELPWWGRFSRVHYQQALDALSRVKLQDYAHRSFGELSGGQMQRALIARALVSNPKILFLDEPTASVDMQSEIDIFDILRDLKNNLTILMVTHDIGAIIHQVQRVFCIQGTVMELNPSEVCEHYALGLYHTPLIKKNSQTSSSKLPLI